MELNFGAMRVGRITLYRITNENADFIRAWLREQPDIDEVLEEFENEYLPEFDAEGRQTTYGFYATLDGELAGLSLLSVDSWHDARGATGADAVPHMRGRGVTPGSKPHLFYLGFELLGLNRIETGCFVSNTSSRRSIEKTPGFKFEGIHRESGRNDDGQFEDELRYSILKREWEALYDKSQVELLAQDRPT